MAKVIDLCDAQTNVDDARQEMDVSPNFCLQHLAMQNAAVNMAAVNGSIDGLHYEGAHTNGDGACGLHTLW